MDKGGEKVEGGYPGPTRGQPYTILTCYLSVFQFIRTQTQGFRNSLVHNCYKVTHTSHTHTHTHTHTHKHTKSKNYHAKSTTPLAV